MNIENDMHRVLQKAMRDGIVPFNDGVMQMVALLQHHAVAVSLVIATKMKSMVTAAVKKRRILMLNPSAAVTQEGGFNC